MNALEEILEKVVAMDFEAIVNDTFNDKEVNDRIIELNQEQLFIKGTDSEGYGLGTYAPITKQIKEAQGLPSEYITLYDTGEFYESMKVFAKDRNIEFDAEGQKEDTNLFEEYGENILGPDEESHEEINEIIIPIIQEKFLDEIL
jgi:hypothetical protein